MTTEEAGTSEHLQPEQLEILALEGGKRLPARSSAHASACARCRRRADELCRLHEALVALVPLRPMSGFVDRVMRRVRLPVPWRARALGVIRVHRVATAGATAGLAASVGIGAAWVARYPDLTPMTVASFLLERATAFLWEAVIGAGQLAYETGLASTALSLAEQFTLLTGFAALTTVAVVGLGALRIMLTLIHGDPDPRPVIGT